MKQVQSSGVLMVFSQAWIEELYHQVLDRNMLAEAGYWGSPEDNSLPLITMLTGQWLITWLCGTQWAKGACTTKLPWQLVTVPGKCYEFTSSFLPIFYVGLCRPHCAPLDKGYLAPMSVGVASSRYEVLSGHKAQNYSWKLSRAN